jgi:hypothetical protein
MERVGSKWRRTAGWTFGVGAPLPTVMSYRLKLFLYAAVCCIAGSVVSYRWLTGFNFPTVRGFSLLMAVMTVVIGRWLFGRKGL